MEEEERRGAEAGVVEMRRKNRCWRRSRRRGGRMRRRGKRVRENKEEQKERKKWEEELTTTRINVKKT